MADSSADHDRDFEEGLAAVLKGVALTLHS